ncbi:hypothetical protein CCH79_00018520, partial [Gambusia affinis]
DQRCQPILGVDTTQISPVDQAVLLTRLKVLAGQALSCVVGGCSAGLDCINVNGVLQCVDPCSRYTELRDEWRSINNLDQSNVKCDQNVNWDGWYRFYLNQKSAAIPEKCVEMNRCGTHAPLYITEPHPTQTNEIVTRTVCNHWTSSCCTFSSHTIKVKLCPGSFYVYKLAKPSVCHLAYCAEIVSQNVFDVKAMSQTETSIVLQWSRLNNLNSFIIQYNGREISVGAPSGNGAVTAAVSSLTAATQYTFTVFAVVGNVRDRGIQFTAATAPPNPSGLVSLNETESSLTLQWNRVNNVKSFILQFNGKETRIDAPAGNGPVTYTVSSLSAETKYTFTLFSEFENIRSTGIQLIAQTDAAAEKFDKATKFNLTLCPLTFYQNVYQNVYVNFTNKNFAICFNRFYNSESNDDCIIGPKPDSGQANFIIREKDSSYEAQSKAAVKTIRSSMTCSVHFDMMYMNKKVNLNLLSFGKQTALHFSSVSSEAKVMVDVAVEGKLVGSVSLGSADSGFADISGCRISGFGILPNSTVRFEKTCRSFTCSIDRSVTSTGCGEQEECDGSGRCFKTQICTVTGPTVIDFQGQQSSVKDRCVYSLVSDSSSGFEVLANFQERRRRDVSFLDSVSLRPAGSNVYFHLEQGGRIKMNETVLTLNSPVQQFKDISLSKDKNGLTATSSFSGLKMSVLFDGYTAQIHMRVPVGSAVVGLCVNSRNMSSVKLLDISSPSCERQYEDPVDSQIDRNMISEHCNLLRVAPFSSCNKNVDPTPYISACNRTLSEYPSADGLDCQFLWAYATACHLQSNITLDRWWSNAGCCERITTSLQRFYSLHAVRITFGFASLQPSLRRFVRTSSAAIMSSVAGNTAGRLAASAELCLPPNTDFLALWNNGSQINYKNTIMTQNSSDVITRHDQVFIDFSCHHTQPDIKIVALRIKDNSVVQHIKSGEWSYSVSMKAYENAGYTRAVNSGVLLNQKMWVELKTDGLDAKTIAVVMDSCWATSKESHNSKPRYDIIKDGCADPDDGTVEVEGNGEGTSTFFSFNMFEFSGDSGDVYLHCKIQLCPKQGNNCIPEDEEKPVFPASKMLRPLLYLGAVMALTGAAGADICTVTGPAVIDVRGRFTPVTDRCVYSVLSDSSTGLEVFAAFRERRRRDVSFLDSVTLKLQDPAVQFHLEQGGRVQMNDAQLNLSSSGQELHSVWISKDTTGVLANFTTSNHTIYLFFDGSTAQIHTETPLWSSVDGLCVNASSTSTQRLNLYSSSSCQIQYNDSLDTSINCSLITDQSCNILKESPFSSCNDDIDPTPYINACSDTLCKYPSVDGLRCHFLWAYARACSLNSRASLGDWRPAGCSSPEAFCQDKFCSDHEFCGEKTGGGTGCLCRAVFAYDYRQSNTLSETAGVHNHSEPTVCRQNSGSITLVGCLLEEKGVDYSVLHLNDRSCRGEMDENHMVTFSFDSSNSCGTEITNNGSQIIYRNAIKYQNSSDIITRQDQFYMDFSCQHHQPGTKTVAFNIKDSSVVIIVKSGEWNYTMAMKAYTDPGLTHALDSTTAVVLNQKIWVELTTTGLDASVIAVETDSCWATSRDSPSSQPRYDLIKNGCADPGDQMVQVEGNGEGTSNRFSFNMFQFTGSTGAVYLHCKLHLCDKQGSSCTPDCSGGSKRRRRSTRSGRPDVISLAWTQ